MGLDRRRGQSQSAPPAPESIEGRSQLVDELGERISRLHTHLGAALVYGQFGVEEDLEAYYRARGFDVLFPGAGFSLAPLGAATTVNAYPHERLFTRWLL